jgi:hypothetical protein
MNNIMTRYAQSHIRESAWSANGVAALVDAAMEGRTDDIEELAKKGATLAGLTPKEVAAILNFFATRNVLTANDSNGDPRELRSLKGPALAKAWVEHDAELGLTKEKIWRRLIELGMPLANFGDGDDITLDNDVHGSVASAAWPLAAEAERGGFLKASAFLHWAWLAMAQDDGARGAAAKARMGGISALDFAALKGMDLQGIPKESLATLAAYQSDGCGIDAPLSSMAARSATLAGPEALSYGYNDLVESTIGRMLHVGLSALGIQNAARIGVDLFALDDKGRGALETLFGLDRAGRYAERAASLLDCAEAVEPGGRARMLAMRGKDLSGPIHWAARALCPQSVALLADLGADPNAKDKAGKTAGHWAARKYGEKREHKVGPTLKALGLAGQRWGEIDNKGVSALAELSAKSPLGPLGDILDHHPETIDAKGAGVSAKSAMDALRARAGGHGAALADRAQIKAELSTGSGAAAAPKGRTSRI